MNSRPAATPKERLTFAAVLRIASNSENETFPMPGTLRSPVVSNAAFLVPAGIALALGLFGHAIFILAAAAASTAYHSNTGGRGVWLDRGTALALILSNISLVATAGWSHPLVWMALVSLAPALFIFYVVGKDDWEWHTLCAVITSCCTLTQASAS